MKHEFDYLKNEFNYLLNFYGLDIIEEYKANTYFYIVWSNKIKNIKICYDFTDTSPIGIYIYDYDDHFMFNYKYMYKEFFLENQIKDKKFYIKLIDYATDKFKYMVDSKIVILN